MKKRRLLITIVSVVLVVIVQLSAGAHKGRTDGSGGHRDNKNVSGLGYYHYHCGGNPPHLHKNGKCPYNELVYEEDLSEESIIEKVSAEIYPDEIVIENKNGGRIEGKIKIKKGEQIGLRAIIKPYNTSNKKVYWDVSNTKIARINELGDLTALAPGKVTVTARAINGVKSNIDVEVYSDTGVITGVASGAGAVATAGAGYYFVRRRKKRENE